MDPDQISKATAMNTDSNPKLEGEEEEEGEKKGKQVVVIMVGAPGSGKSTFCELVMQASSRPWARICQDNINNGKSGTKPQCLKSAAIALNEGKSVFIDRCNLDREQRAEFVKLGNQEVDVHAVVVDLPARVCISRSVKRTGHEGNLQGGKAAAVVNRMLQKKEWPKLGEGFTRITFCHTESNVDDAVKMYSSFGPGDMLPSGCFGEKTCDAEARQVSIMKFLKRKDGPANSESNTSSNLISSPMSLNDKNLTSSKGPSIGDAAILNSDTPTLAFPSISTADFRFDHENASNIIVEKVQEYMDKIGNARLVLVDLTHKSKILSLVKTKAAERNISSSKFFTFVGDITRLYTGGGLRCNVIANAANWRLKPGGGGVNAAIFSAAGPALETATKERAKSLTAGNAIVVPLPQTSPLFKREGVTHIIHVLGPNMNPQRPNCLNNNYEEGSRILREAYSSLFEGFMSILNHENRHSECTEFQENTEDMPKRLKYAVGHGNDVSEHQGKSHINGRATKGWGSWAQALYKIAMNPERHSNDVLEIINNVVVIKDLYPKAKRHILVLSRLEGLDRLADVRQEHLQLLKTMHEAGMRWIDKFLQDDASLVFRLGYHSVPSMRQLHLHVISQDFESQHLKHKKHWNSFNTDFFRDSLDVIEEVDRDGKASSREESLLSTELRCHRCKSAHPNMPRLKSHISGCRAPFPISLVQKGQLVRASGKEGMDT